MTYVIDDISPQVDEALRHRAAREGTSVEALLRETATRLAEPPHHAESKKRDFSRVIGSPGVDEGFMEAMRDHARIDDAS